MMQRALTYDDVLLEPKASRVASRTVVNTQSSLTPTVDIDVPLVSAPMDSVTGREMAQSLADAGGIGILHRAAEMDEVVGHLESIEGLVGASVGISRFAQTKAEKYEQHGADVIVVDVAHGHLDNAVYRVGVVSDSVDVPVIAGNVATYDGAKSLAQAGADGIKVGVGPGSACTTRLKTGVGVPQFSAIQNVANVKKSHDVTIIADGGIREPGDAVKAIAAGADSVMLGGEFAKCAESPADGSIWGMASAKGKETHGAQGYVEGISSHPRETTTTVDEVVGKYIEGIQSGCSYCNALSVRQLHENATFNVVTPAAYARNGGFADD
jgi:IMP dehydrogenase/GMP reductase